MDNVCRFCAMNNVALENIFDERGRQGNQSLLYMLEYTTNCDIRESDLLPQNICATCISAAKTAFQFKLKCEQSEKYFKELLVECDQKPNFDELITGDWCVTETYAGEVNIKTEKLDDPLEEDNFEGIEADSIIKEEANDLLVEYSMDDYNQHHICPHCNRKYSEKSLLLKHLVVHSKETSFKCEHCPKVFKQGFLLLRHQKRVHCDDRPYKCDLCPKALKSRDCLKRHLVTHTDERPFKCEHCMKTFKRDRELKQHALIHGTTRPFKCQRCPLTFKINAALKKHQLTHNPPSKDL